LGKELLPYRLSVFAAIGERIPDNMYKEIRVVPRMHNCILNHTLSKDGAIDKDIDVEIGNGSRVVCRIGEIHVEL